MNVEELRALLRLEPVPEDAFVIDGPPADEAYVLAREGTGWVVYYSERGLRSDERRFSSEDQACGELLRRLRRGFAFEGADALRDRLLALTNLLIECDEPRWAGRLGGLASDLDPAACDADRQQVVRSVLGLYGGTGSFSDVVLQDASGALPEQNRFDSLRTDLFELARRELR